MTTELSLMDDSVKARIRTMYLDGKGFYQIIDELGIPKGTWDNYQYLNKGGLRDFILDVKKEYMLQETEKITRKILSFDTDEISDKKLAIQQKEAEFLRETLGKDVFSKRVETIGLNVHKTEPLDKEQQEKLDKILGSKGKEIKDVSFSEVKDDLSNLEEEKVTE